MLLYYATDVLEARRIPYVVKLYPVKDYWELKGFSHGTDYCSEHSPRCIRYATSFPVCSFGTWAIRKDKLIDVIRDIPGENKKLVSVSFRSMIKAFGIVTANTRNFKILENDVTVWEAKDNEISQEGDRWATNSYNPNLDVYGKIGASLFTNLCCFGSAEVHFSDFILTFEYTRYVTPTYARVIIRVTDAKTTRPVHGAYVQILHGNKLVAHGYTDKDGYVAFSGVRVYEGITTSYTVSITKQNYLEIIDTIELEGSGEYVFSYTLNPVPQPPPEIPWWATYVAYGVAGIVGAGVFYQLVIKKLFR